MYILLFIKYAIISFACSFILIIISKVILDKILRRDKDYYEKDERNMEEKMLSKIKTVKVTDEER